MKRTKSFTFITFSGLFLAILLFAACRSEPAPSPTPSPTIAPTLPPTATPTLQPTIAPAASPPAPTLAPASPPAPTPTFVPTVTPTLPPTPTPPPFPPGISLQPFVTLSEEITYLTHAGDGRQRIFVVEKKGRVRVVENGVVQDEPFLDISDVVDSAASERGLLSIAFPPDFAKSGYFYVNYTAREGDGDTVVARYAVSDDPNLADPQSGEILLQIDQPEANHNGGQLQFGPDGYLYIGMGDGGSAGDPWDNAENLNTLLGKMLRIDVKEAPGYVVPGDNPFVDRRDARAAIWAYGLRNPWRFSFDRATGDMYIADVGQNKWEEINFEPAGGQGGLHYGWNTLEGNHCFDPPEGCDASGKVAPIYEYDHSQGCSITGGYVYRGRAYPALEGVYFYGDFCTGNIWGLRRNEQGEWRSALLLDTEVNIASFGEDEAGELYVLDLGGAIYRVVESTP
ncbi:MAG: PQQ-dependent sugar dehydrogenase [Chloroflexi bacterium]|nr:PQQ-dependent sugar dehydrogenase [Chloroflexota bacterium]